MPSHREIANKLRTAANDPGYRACAPVNLMLEAAAALESAPVGVTREQVSLLKVALSFAMEELAFDELHGVVKQTGEKRLVGHALGLVRRALKLPLFPSAPAEPPCERIPMVSELPPAPQPAPASELAQLRARVAELKEILATAMRGQVAALEQVDELESENAALAADVLRLKAFKSYVHQRLDEAGVSKDPESPHKAAGCRIGGRLDEVIFERNRLRQAYEQQDYQQTQLAAAAADREKAAACERDRNNYAETLRQYADEKNWSCCRNTRWHDWWKATDHGFTLAQQVLSAAAPQPGEGRPEQSEQMRHVHDDYEGPPSHWEHLRNKGEPE